MFMNVYDATYNFTICIDKSSLMVKVKYYNSVVQVPIWHILVHILSVDVIDAGYFQFAIAALTEPKKTDGQK